MKITKNITTVNRTVYSTRPIDYIVIHFVGAFGSAEQNSKYFKNVNRNASAHYFVDSKSIYQVVEDKDASWHCGDRGQGEYKGVCQNKNSIGIEMCVNKLDKKSTASADKDWYFDPEVVVNTKWLVKELMQKYNVPIDRVIRHYDVTSKWCPRPFVGNDINTYYGKTGHQLWVKFKQDLTKKEETAMDGKMIFEELTKYLNSLPTSEYAKESSKKGIASGLFVDGDGDGLIDNPQGILTREQLAVVLNRAGMLGE